MGHAQDVGVMITSTAKRGARFLAKSAFVAADAVAADTPGPRILIYHQVGADMGRQMEVTEQDFAGHLAWMRSNGSVVRLEDAIGNSQSHRADRTFVLTFDDGYRDVYENAWPLLRDQSLPFTLYVTTDPVESQQALTPGGSAEPLTWAQINEMLESGLMTLGAHTHTHPDLRNIDSGTIRKEIEQSNGLIMARTGVNARHFTYPWGYWAQAADGIIRDTYDTATLGSGPRGTREIDPYLVNRIPVQLSDGTFFFKRKMTRGMRLEDTARRRLTGYKGP